LPGHALQDPCAGLTAVSRLAQIGPPSMTRLARQLGYADPRSVRRALRRWDQSR